LSGPDALPIIARIRERKKKKEIATRKPTFSIESTRRFSSLKSLS